MYKHKKIFSVIAFILIALVGISPAQECKFPTGKRFAQGGRTLSRDIKHAVNKKMANSQSVSVSDSNTTLIGRWATGTCTATYVVGNLAYIGIGASLKIFDISDPSAPLPLGEVNVPSTVVDIYISGSYAYVADGWGGLRIVDVNTPSSPVEAAVYNTGGYAYGVFVADNYAYVANGDSGLCIIDVRTPSSPVEAGSTNTSGSAYDVYVSGSYAYVAYGGEGLRIIDVSTPSSPMQVGFSEFDGWANGVFVAGSCA